MFTDPTVADFKAYFFRDFPYQPAGVQDLETVQDQDILNAYSDVQANFNSELVSDQAVYTLFFLTLAAHYMVVNLRNSSQGTVGSYKWLPSSQSAGSVAASYSIPQRIMDNPYLATFCTTQYGGKYLSLVLPLINGNMFTEYGPTKP